MRIGRSALCVVVANGPDSSVEQIRHVYDAGLAQSQAVGIVEVELGRRPAIGGGALHSGARDSRDRPVRVDLADPLTVMVGDQHVAAAIDCYGSGSVDERRRGRSCVAQLPSLSRYGPRHGVDRPVVADLVYAIAGAVG